MFPGHSDFLQFVCCVLPASVLFYIGAVMLSIGSVRSIADYIRSGLRSAPGGVYADHLLACALRPLLMLIPIGLLCLIVNTTSSTGECINPIIQTTIATVQTDSTWQWLWVILSCCASMIATVFLASLQPHRIQCRGEHNQTQWFFLMGNSHGSALKQAVEAWRSNLPALGSSSPSAVHHRVLINWLLHLPVLCIAMAPSAGYVSRLHLLGVSDLCADVRCWRQMCQQEVPQYIQYWGTHW